MRHEGWHVKVVWTGTIDNSMIDHQTRGRSSYDLACDGRKNLPRVCVPWEAEAGWAGRTEGMTQVTLESCARGTMWTDYTPTPMTGEWLIQNGFWDGNK